MSDEIYDGAGHVLGDAESTYGTDPTPTTVRYFERFSPTITQASLAREGLSAEGPGRRPVLAGAVVEIEAEAELSLPSLNGSGAGIVASQYPTIHDLLHAAQWAQTIDNTDETITYVLLSRGKQGVTWYHFAHNDDGSDTNRTKCVGSAGALSLEWAYQQKLMVTFSGKALGFKTTGLPADVFGSGGSVGSITEADQLPSVGLGATIKLIDLSDNSLLGGGTLASPGNNIMISRLAFNSGQEVFEEGGLNSTGGPTRIRVRRKGVATIEMDVEVQDAAEWTPQAKMCNSAGEPARFEINFQLTEGSNTMQLLAYGFLTEVGDPTEDEGRLFQTLTFSLGYPEDSDGDPAVGVSPTQTFTAGTNQGLMFQPTAALSKGIVALQFYTDNS